MTSNSWHLFSVIKKEDKDISNDILKLANDTYNKLNGLKSIKNEFCQYTRYELAVNYRIEKVNKYDKKCEEKIDSIGHDITRLMLEIIKHYKK